MRSTPDRHLVFEKGVLPGRKLRPFPKRALKITGAVLAALLSACFTYLLPFLKVPQFDLFPNRPHQAQQPKDQQPKEKPVYKGLERELKHLNSSPCLEVVYRFRDSRDSRDRAIAHGCLERVFHNEGATASDRLLSHLHTQRGRLLIWDGKSARAISDLETASELNPDNSEAAVFLLRAYKAEDHKLRIPSPPWSLDRQRRIDDLGDKIDALEKKLRRRKLSLFEPASGSIDLRGAAYTYDNALAALAFLADDNSDGLRRARLVGDALVYSAKHDLTHVVRRMPDEPGVVYYHPSLPPGWTSDANREDFAPADDAPRSLFLWPMSGTSDDAFHTSPSPDFAWDVSSGGRQGRFSRYGTGAGPLYEPIRLPLMPLFESRGGTLFSINNALGAATVPRSAQLLIDLELGDLLTTAALADHADRYQRIAQFVGDLGPHSDVLGGCRSGSAGASVWNNFAYGDCGRLPHTVSADSASDAGARVELAYATALAVGVNAGNTNGLGALKYAAADALRVSAALGELNFRSTALTNTLATRRNILSALSVEVNASRGDQVFVFYFSGHGFTDTNGRPVLVTGGGVNGATETLSLEEIIHVLSFHRGEAIVILDNCLNAIQLDSGTPQGLAAGPNRPTIILAGAPGDRVIEAPRLGSGLFTFTLLRFLEQQADDDIQHNFDVYAAFRFTAAETSRLARELYGEEQHPQLLRVK